MIKDLTDQEKSDLLNDALEGLKWVAETLAKNRTVGFPYVTVYAIEEHVRKLYQELTAEVDYD